MLIPCSHVAASAARSRRDHCLLWTRLATPAAGRRRPQQLQVGDVGCGSSCLDSLRSLTSCIRNCPTASGRLAKVKRVGAVASLRRVRAVGVARCKQRVAADDGCRMTFSSGPPRVLRASVALVPLPMMPTRGLAQAVRAHQPVGRCWYRRPRATAAARASRAHVPAARRTAARKRLCGAVRGCAGLCGAMRGCAGLCGAVRGCKGV